MKTPATKARFESLESRIFLSIIPSSVVTNAAQRVSASATAPPTGLTAEYFEDAYFNTPVVVRTENQINFNYKRGRPDLDIPSGVFTTSWTGTLIPATTGVYTLYTNSNSGTRVIINGTTVLDNFTNQTNAISQGNVALTAGQSYSITVEYVSQPKGPAKMQLLWSADGIAKQLVPRSVLFPDTTVALPAEPLLGTYYLGGDFQTQVMTRADSQIRFDWQEGSPDPIIPYSTPFSVRWTGQITAPTTGSYSFESITDDGVRLSINGTQIINDWNVHSAQADYGKITLTAGQTYSLTMEYFQNGAGHASAKLLWKIPGSNAPEKFVPFTATNAVGIPTNVAASGVSTTQIHVTWNDVPDETGFSILRATNGGSNFTQVGTTAQGITAFDDTTLVPGTSYQYEIVALGASNSAPSSPATGTTLSGPTAVVASATITGFNATVSWTASPTAADYLLERSPDGTDNWTSVTNTAGTTFTDSGLAPGIYYYRVTAINTQGSSAASNVVTVTTSPAAPAQLLATATSSTEIDLTWNDVANENGFEILEGPIGATTFTQVGTTAMGVTSFPVGGLTPATGYNFEVIAIASSTAGNSAPSNIAAATTLAAPPSYASFTSLYGLTDTAKAYRLDQTTGAVTQIGTLSFGTDAGGRDPISGDFFYISIGTSTVQIAKWDPTTGTNTLVNASVPLGNPTAEAAFRQDGQFFLTTDMGQLFAINSTTGAATLKGVFQSGGSTLLTGTGDIAFAPDGTLFIETASELYSVSSASVNAANGGASLITATNLGPTGTTNLQIAFGQNGILFGEDANGQLYTVSTTTGTATTTGAAATGVLLNDLASIPAYADLGVTQTASSFVRGTNGTYTLSVSNAGPQPTDGPITLIDTLPAGQTFVSGSGTGWTFSQSGQTVTMTYTGSVASGASAPAITLAVAVASSAASSVSNSVVVNTTIFDPSLANNTSTLTSPVTG